MTNGNLTLNNVAAPSSGRLTYADLNPGDVFTRVRVRGYRDGVLPRTVYMATPGGAVIIGTVDGQPLDAGDSFGDVSKYVHNDTPVRLHGRFPGVALTGANFAVTD